MPKADDPDLFRRLTRRLPLVGGFVAIVLLLAFASGIRFAGDSDDVPGDQDEVDVASGQDSRIERRDPEPSSPVTLGPTTLATPAIQPPDASTPIEDPTYGGSVTVGVVGTPDSLNPFVAEGNDDAVQAFRSLVWASAMQLDPQTLEPRPGVVVETPTLGNGGLTINQDGTMTVRYEIRQDAVWEDGVSLTFDDFLRTYEVATSAANINPSVFARYASIVEGSVLGEGASVSFTVGRPSLGFVELFDILLPAHQVEVGGFASEWNDELWLSAGPFRFVRRSGDDVVFAANPAAGITDEDGNPLPFLDALTIRFLRSDSEATDALVAGDVDIAGTLQDRRLIEQIDDEPDLDVDVRYGPKWEQLSFQFGEGRFDENPDSVIDSLELRQEVARRIDRTALAELALGRYAKSVDSMIAFSWPSADTGAWSIYDEAHELEACCEGAVIAFVTSAGDEQRAASAAHLVERLDQVGVRIEVELEELGRFFEEKVIPGRFELAEWNWTATLGPVGAASDLVDRYATLAPDGNNFSQFAVGDDLSEAEAEFRDLVNGLDAVLSYDDLRERVTRIERILADQVVLIPLFADLNVGASRPSVVGGFVHATPEGGITATAATWWDRR